MTKDEKHKARQRMNLIQLLGPLYSRSRLALLTVLLSVAVVGAFHGFVERLLDRISDPTSIEYQNIAIAGDNLIFAFVTASIFCMIFILLYPFEKKKAESLFYSIGLHNSVQQVPKLIRKQKDLDCPHLIQLEFSNPGIPLEYWENALSAVEAAFDFNVLSVSYGRNKNKIIIRAAQSYNLPDCITWDDKYLNKEDFVLTLGEGYTGLVTADLAKTPNMLLGGSTGSGKTILLKLLLMQALKKGAEVYIADFKGGVDFPEIWENNGCYICYTEDALIGLLTEFVEEIERRKKLLKKAGCSNISEYNRVSKISLNRLIFACDEAAEIFDRYGADKEKKEKINLIENKLSIMARQGRAFGVHLILCTQRPDATLIPGQIRTNIGTRICGRADQILSQIVLDSSDAAKKIDKDACGRFLMNDGTLFQGFWFDDEKIFD